MICEIDETYPESVHTTKSKHLTKKYNSAWEKYRPFKDWIAASKTGKRCFHCKLCNCDFDGGITAARRHSLSEIHIREKTTPVHKIQLEIAEITGKEFFRFAATCEAVFLVVYDPRYLYEILEVLEETAKSVILEFQGRLRIAKAQHHNFKRLFELFGIFYTPFLLFYKYKQEAVIYHGLRTTDSIMEFFRTQMDTIK